MMMMMMMKIIITHARFRALQYSSIHGKSKTKNHRNEMPLPNYHDSLLTILTPLSPKLMFRTGRGYRRSGPLGLGIGPLHMPGIQFC